VHKIVTLVLLISVNQSNRLRVTLFGVEVCLSRDLDWLDRVTSRGDEDSVEFNESGLAPVTLKRLPLVLSNVLKLTAPPPKTWIDEAPNSL